MTSDEEKDPPVPSYLEGVSLKRVHNGPAADEDDADDTEAPESGS